MRLICAQDWTFTSLYPAGAKMMVKMKEEEEEEEEERGEEEEGGNAIAGT